MRYRAVLQGRMYSYVASKNRHQKQELLMEHGAWLD